MRQNYARGRLQTFWQKIPQEFSPGFYPPMFSTNGRSSPAIQSATSTTSNSVGVLRITTRTMPALMTIRRHMAQLVASPKIYPVWAFLPTRYRVPPTMSRREAEMMALASAWTLRHSSYRSPRGTRRASRVQ